MKLMPCYAFDTAPHDEDKAFLAWHIVWKCWVPLRRRIEQQIKTDGVEWIDGTLSVAWPTKAFSHWMPMPDEPAELVSLYTYTPATPKYENAKKRIESDIRQKNAQKAGSDL